ncbi:hypothetical protein [Pedobacter sp. BMA]|uniref:hypothetical protein n=1 Tax=Pedobacter sp. BMA TaxID=1663685 RepID=UPI00064B58C7|nr:hypothetical protein [Pedobacter sp. BMA]KLT67043.1 hypothetical protein AB669_03805 [Pedobacter sp. BMA]
MKTLKKLIIILLIGITTQAQAQHTLTKIWESDTTLAVPESVLLSASGMYVSLVDGQAWDADGKGGIAKIDRDGKIINANWVSGLHAPKGMGLWKNRLYVADITEVVVIDTLNGNIDSRIPITGAKGLNDITVDAKGVIYVSDSELGIVTKIKNGKPSTYLKGHVGANGLKAIGDNLYMVSDGGVLKIGANKKITRIGSIPKKGSDGLEPIGDREFLFTIYSGQIFYLNARGDNQLLLDTEAKKIYSADIAYDPASHMVYVPTLFGNSVVAYRLD